MDEERKVGVMAGPIKPNEVQSKKDASIPEEVFAAFNEMIAAKWNGRDSRFTLAEVAELACAKLKEKVPGVSRGMLSERGWLDVEESYRKAGWRVDYDRPGYNETYPATFTFEKNTR